MILSIKKVFRSETLEDQKIHFDEFHREQYRSITSYGIAKGSIYYLGYLKAFPNRSGYWFSQKPEITNPYGVTTKFSCGFVAAKLN